MLTIYTITYNESFMLPHFVAHYRLRFPACRIVVYDNYSTDDTPQIAKNLGCEVRPYETGGRLDDATYLQIKNNCWQDDAPPHSWVLIADCDEFCHITQRELLKETAAGTTVITFAGWNMVNTENNLDLKSIKKGVRAQSYDKLYLFSTGHIKQINYHMGCHTAAPIGTVIPSKKVYRALHYKYLNPDYMIYRHSQFAKRLSPLNLQKGYGGHYLNTPDQIRAEFAEARQKAITIL